MGNCLKNGRCTNAVTGAAAQKATLFVLLAKGLSSQTLAALTSELGLGDRAAAGCGRMDRWVWLVDLGSWRHRPFAHSVFRPHCLAPASDRWRHSAAGRRSNFSACRLRYARNRRTSPMCPQERPCQSRDCSPPDAHTNSRSRRTITRSVFMSSRYAWHQRIQLRTVLRHPVRRWT